MGPLEDETSRKKQELTVKALEDEVVGIRKPWRTVELKILMLTERRSCRGSWKYAAGRRRYEGA